MYQKHPYTNENSPFTQGLYLLMLAILGVIVLGILGMVAIYAGYGPEGLAGAAGTEPRYVGAFKILLVAQQLGIFLVPAILLAVVEKKPLSTFYQLSRPKTSLLFWVAVLSVCWLPIMSLVNEWNQQMALPGFLKGIEQWMRAKEDEAAQLTLALLKMDGVVPALLVNLVVIAVVPAICEEFLFRGAVQRTALRMTANPHLAVWFSAIVFSAIHLQFYGFLPRMLLGAAFGYLCLWTGNIWYAVFAHFLNNAYAVIAAFYLQAQQRPYQQAEEVDLPWYGYLMSAILTLVLFNLVRKLAVRESKI